MGKKWNKKLTLPTKGDNMDNINRYKMSQSPNVWQDVKKDIEYKILTGVFIAGERIPPIRKIAKDYSISQCTAQKILNTLYQEGIIESKRGVGFFVKPYIREKLLSEHKRNLEKIVINAVEEAALIGVDLMSMVEKYIKIKSDNKSL